MRDNQGILDFEKIIKLCICSALMILYVVPTPAQPAVAKKKFYLFLLAGQSNMSGRGAVEGEDTITNNRIWVLNKNNQWQLAAEPLHFDKPKITGVGPGFAFARKLLLSDTNIVIGLIPSAVGGTSIDLWKPFGLDKVTGAHPYDDAVNRTKFAMQSGTLKGILWHQGESDSDSIRSKSYEEKLTQLITLFRREFENETLPFVAGTIGDFYVKNHSYAYLVNTAIVSVSKKIRYVSVVYTTGLTDNGDQTHFNAESARELGKKYATVFENWFQKNNNVNSNKR